MVILLTMKTETLVKIAKLMEKELRLRLPGTVDEVKARLVAAAGNCKTKPAAIDAIAREVFDLDEDEEPSTWIKATTLYI